MTNFAEQETLFQTLDGYEKRISALERYSRTLSGRTLSANSTGDLTLSASEQDVPGATVTTPDDGFTRTWLIIGTFYITQRLLVQF